MHLFSRTWFIEVRDQETGQWIPVAQSRFRWHLRGLLWYIHRRHPESQQDRTRIVRHPAGIDYYDF